jgi:uncharacterized protein (TIGR00369 family)
MNNVHDEEAERRVRDSFGAMQVMATIGASLRRIGAGEVEIELPFTASLTQQHGFLHAGIVATILDTACGYAALTLMPQQTGVLTTEFKINFLSPARGDRFVAAGRVVRPGRKLMVCLGEVFAEKGDARRQVALMTASMMVIEGANEVRD